jgi:hypothetical protein
MPSLDTIDRIGRLQQRINELAASKEIDAKHINVLLSKERQRAFDTEWKRQQKLRKAKKPASLNKYETLHKQTTALLARCLNSGTRTKAEQATLTKLQNKCLAAIEVAHAEIIKQLNKKPALNDWLDRTASDTLTAVELRTGNQAAAKHSNTVLAELYEQLPILVTSKNERRRVTQEQRFGWQTKRDIRLRLLRETLDEVSNNLDTELEREQLKRQVKEARVFLDAYFKAVDEHKNPLTAANAALQRNGFKRLDVQYSRGSNRRVREVREMEEALLKWFEAAMTEEEREQLAMSKEYDKQAGRAGK